MCAEPESKCLILVLALLSGYLGAGSPASVHSQPCVSACCIPGTVLDAVGDAVSSACSQSSRAGRNKCERGSPGAVSAQRKDTGPRLGGVVSKLLGESENSAKIRTREGGGPSLLDVLGLKFRTWP